MALIENRSIDDPVTEGMWNEIVNRLNGLAPNTLGIAVYQTVGSFTWTVPEGITTETRIRVWVCGGGGSEGGTFGFDSTSYPGGNASWAYRVFQGYSGGQSVPITVGGEGAASNFNSGALVSNAGPNQNGTPAGPGPGTTSGATIVTSAKIDGKGIAGGRTSAGGVAGPTGGAVVIEW